MIFPDLLIAYAENRYILRWWQPKHDELLQLRLVLLNMIFNILIKYDIS